MNLQIGDRVEHLTHNTTFGPGTVTRIGITKIEVFWQRKNDEIAYYKNGSFEESGPIVIKLAEPVNYTTIPNLGNIFTLECGTRILKGTDGRLLQLVNNSGIKE